MGLASWFSGSNKKAEARAPAPSRRIRLETQWLEAVAEQFETLERFDQINLIRDIEDGRAGDPSGMWRQRPSLIGVKGYEPVAPTYTDEPEIVVGAAGDFEAGDESLARQLGMLEPSSITPGDLKQLLGPLAFELFKRGNAEAAGQLGFRLGRCISIQPEGDS